MSRLITIEALEDTPRKSFLINATQSAREYVHKFVFMVTPKGRERLVAHVLKVCDAMADADYAVSFRQLPIKKQNAIYRCIEWAKNFLA